MWMMFTNKAFSENFLLCNIGQHFSWMNFEIKGGNLKAFFYNSFLYYFTKDLLNYNTFMNMIPGLTGKNGKDHLKTKDKRK